LKENSKNPGKRKTAPPKNGYPLFLLAIANKKGGGRFSGETVFRFPGKIQKNI